MIENHYAAEILNIWTFDASFIILVVRNMYENTMGYTINILHDPTV